MFLEFEPIGVVHSCYGEKFAIPRQPGLVSEARANLELIPPYDRPEAVRGLEGFSHIWVVFVFHGVQREKWKPTVRPPRLGGNERVGVFASRSTHRPNPIGLSVVRLESIDTSGDGVVLHLSGVDLLDGTPVLDIKPYIPYVDAVSEATAGFAPEAPPTHPVHIDPPLQEKLQGLEGPTRPELVALIEDLLRYDHRPAYRTEGDDGRVYGTRLYDLNVRWCYRGGQVELVDVEPAQP